MRSFGRLSRTMLAALARNVRSPWTFYGGEQLPNGERGRYVPVEPYAIRRTLRGYGAGSAAWLHRGQRFPGPRGRAWNHPASKALAYDARVVELADGSGFVLDPVGSCHLILSPWEISGGDPWGRNAKPAVWSA